MHPELGKQQQIWGKQKKIIYRASPPPTLDAGPVRGLQGLAIMLSQNCSPRMTISFKLAFSSDDNNKDSFEEGSFLLPPPG
jgi:hypothetical protein